MRIAITKPITVINAGAKRTSSLILSSSLLISFGPETASRLSTKKNLRVPKTLERLLMTPDMTSNLEMFFEPEEYVPDRPEERLTLPSGQYELLPVDNPYLRENTACHEPWFAIADIAERVGMPLACWAEHIARGSVDLIHD